MPGTLFVVATPIGNLEDVTFRAIRTLREVELIAAEDTRRTSKLLAHYEIRKPLVSVHEHNEMAASPGLVARMLAGESIALVSDAGTPGIADPGALLVAAARAAGVKVVPIPGPSAVAAALSVSGFSGDEFVFMGFPPRSGQERARWFERLAEDDRIVVLYEAPHRAARTLSELQTLFSGKRQILYHREITKINEESVILPTKTPDPFPLIELGEFVIVLGPAHQPEEPELRIDSVFDTFCRITELAGVDEPDAITMLAAKLGAKPAKVAKAIKQAKIARNRQLEQQQQ